MNRIISILFLLLAVMPIMAAGQDAEEEARSQYAALIAEFEQKRSSMGQAELIRMAEEKLSSFVQRFPGTSSSGSARVVLAQIYSNTGRGNEAVQELNKYLACTCTKQPMELGVARMILGSTYLSMNMFDEAEIQFREIASAESGADPKTKQSAAMTLSQINTLKKLKIGNPAIDFSATAVDGKKIDLKQYRGKVVLIDFWATWCSPCRAEMPNVKRVYAENHGKGFDIIGISMDESREKFDNYIKEQKIEWRQVFDGKGWKAELGRLYAVSSIPSTLILDRKGIIRYKNLRGNELGEAVKILLDE
ncbi:MAG: redoxin domain-containing protein [Candidatus Krumholzibacteriota bacterium]|nr:redoxin domain-containing protein [Candidatus Krumholzibacteriota bacterium]